MAEAIWISNGKEAELGEGGFLDLVHSTLRDPKPPYGYGHGRKKADPRVGRVRYRDVTPPGYPVGRLCIPNEEDSPHRSFSFYDWPEDHDDPGIVIAKGIKDESKTGD